MDKAYRIKVLWRKNDNHATLKGFENLESAHNWIIKKNGTLVDNYFFTNDKEIFNIFESPFFQTVYLTGKQVKNLQSKKNVSVFDINPYLGTIDLYLCKVNYNG